MFIKIWIICERKQRDFALEFFEHGVEKFYHLNTETLRPDLISAAILALNLLLILFRKF